MDAGRRISPCSIMDREHISLCEILDRVLTKGVVVVGEVIISVADVDLIYLGLQLVLTSVETANKRQALGAGARALRSEVNHACS